MHDVLEELSEDFTGRNTEHVDRRVKDWSARISSLYQQVSAWLPSEYSTDASQTLQMYEPMMKEYKVEPVELPTLNIYRNGQWKAKLVPKGLWIIGTNGQLNLFAETIKAVITDKAELFQKPDWFIAPSEIRRKIKPLTEKTWRAMLKI